MTPRNTGVNPVSQDVRAQIPVLISDLGYTRVFPALAEMRKAPPEIGF